jgi:hypothetical protein
MPVGGISEHFSRGGGSARVAQHILYFCSHVLWTRYDPEASNVGHSTNRAITKRCRRLASTADPIALPGVCEIFVTDTDDREAYS